MKPNAQLVKTFLLQLQDEICQKLDRKSTRLNSSHRT